MKTESVLPPNYILDTYKSKDDLLFYLRMKFKNPTIEIYINGFGDITGFTCVSSSGEIYSSLTKPTGKIEVYNGIEENNKSSKLFTDNLQSKLYDSEKVNFYLKVAIVTIIMGACCLFYNYNKQKNTIESLKQELLIKK